MILELCIRGLFVVLLPLNLHYNVSIGYAHVRF